MTDNCTKRKKNVALGLILDPRTQIFLKLSTVELPE
jgi:hypothetical protein